MLWFYMCAKLLGLLNQIAEQTNTLPYRLVCKGVVQFSSLQYIVLTESQCCTIPFNSPAYFLSEILYPFISISSIANPFLHLVTIALLSTSMSFMFLDFTCKRDYVGFVFWCLSYFT